MPAPTQAQTAILTSSNSKILHSAPSYVWKGFTPTDIRNDQSRSSGIAKRWKYLRDAALRPSDSAELIATCSTKGGAPVLMLLTAISTAASLVSAVCALVSILRRPGRANTSHVARTGVLRWGQLRLGSSQRGPYPHQGVKEARRPRTRVQPGRVGGVRRRGQERRFRRLPQSGNRNQPRRSRGNAVP
jgi:hypothetical protein